MIEFKQKIFWGTAITAASSILPAVMGGKQQREATAAQQEMTEATNKQMAKQTKALNNLAEAAKKNPGAGQMLAQAGMSGPRQQSYSATTARKVGSEVLGFGKIIGNLAKDRKLGKTISGNVISGVTGAGIAYGVNKALFHDAKKNGMMTDPIQTEKDKKERRRNRILAGAAALGTTGLVLGSKYGKLPAGVSKHVNSVVNNVKEAGKDQFTKIGDDGKRKLRTGSILMTVGAGTALPTIGYVMRKKQFKNQIQDQEQAPQQIQRQYSAPIVTPRPKFNLKSVNNSINNFGKNTKVGRFGKSALLGVGSYFSKGATNGTQKFSRDLLAYGRNENNRLAIKTGTFMKNHDKLVKVAAIPVGAAVLGAGAKTADKVTRKTLGAFDKNAYAYDRAQEQQVE